MKILTITAVILLIPSLNALGFSCPATPTPIPGWWISVDPLPAHTTELSQIVTGTTGPYSNVTVLVTDMTSCATSSFFQFGDYSFAIPITLYPDTVNEIAVTACDDVWPPDCSTVSSANAEGLSVDTRPIVTPAMSPLGVLMLLVGFAVIITRK